MYVSNLHDYGHLLNADTYDTTRLHGDMYQMFDNKLVREGGGEGVRVQQEWWGCCSLYMQL